MNELRNKQGLTEKEFLDSYNSNQYEKPSVTTDFAIFTTIDSEIETVRQNPEKELQVLLVKRMDHPYLGKWALPGGFVNMDEDLDTAAYRELKEETGISNIYAEQLYTWGEVNRDPRMRVISVSYLALVDSSQLEIEAGSDAEEVDWFTVSEEVLNVERTEIANGYNEKTYKKITLKSKETELYSTILLDKVVQGTNSKVTRTIIEQEGIAFDHARIIEFSLERLRNKAEYTNIVFNLMPEEFTLYALQKAYEAILNKELLDSNFRRKVNKMLVETDKMQKIGAFRPAKLYKYNAEWSEFS